MSDIMKIEGALVRLERETRSLTLRMDGLVKAMRDNLDPMAKPEHLPVEVILEQAFDLELRHSEYVEKRAEIAKAKDLLGR